MTGMTATASEGESESGRGRGQEKGWEKRKGGENEQ